MFLVQYPEQSKCLSKEAEITCQANASRYVPEPSLFHRVFPFHIVIDKDMRAVQMGTGLRRMIPAMTQGCRVTDHLQVPIKTMTYNSLRLNSFDLHHVSLLRWSAPS